MTSPAAQMPPGYTLHHFDVLTSTMDQAHLLAAQGAPANTLVLADIQTQGRGRRGRTWISPRGNFYLSIILRPSGFLDSCSNVSFIVSLAIGKALVNFLPQRLLQNLSYKEPNDVLIQGKKIAGTLIEAETDPLSCALRWMICGVGVNLTESPPDTHSTSLRDQEGTTCSVSHFLPLFCQSLTHCFTQYASLLSTNGKPGWKEQAWGLTVTKSG